MNVRHILKCGLNLTIAGARPTALAYVVDPNTVLTPYRDPEIHTQSVESMWKRAKRKLRAGSGTSAELFPSYVMEAMWRENYAHDDGKEVFASMLHLITQY